MRRIMAGLITSILISFVISTPIPNNTPPYPMNPAQPKSQSSPQVDIIIAGLALDRAMLPEEYSGWTVVELSNKFKELPSIKPQSEQERKELASQVAFALKPAIENGAHLYTIGVPPNEPISASNLVMIFNDVLKHCIHGRRCVLALPTKIQLQGNRDVFDKMAQARTMDQHNQLQKLDEGVVTVMPVKPTTGETFKQMKGGSGKNAVLVAPQILPESCVHRSDVDFLESTAILQTAALMAQIVMLHPYETPKEVKKRLYDNTTPRRTLKFPVEKTMLDQIAKEVEGDPEVKDAARILKSFLA